jgi:hypothetical protein
MIHQGPAENRPVIAVRVEPPTRSDRSGAQGLPPSTPPPRSLTERLRATKLKTW